MSKRVHKLHIERPKPDNLLSLCGLFIVYRRSRGWETAKSSPWQYLTKLDCQNCWKTFAEVVPGVDKNPFPGII